MRKNNGITLISLIITVVVMLILATVSISFIKNGVIDNALQAKAQTEKSNAKEILDIAIEECKIEYYENQNLDIEYMQYLYNNLQNHLSDFSNVNLEWNNKNIIIAFSYLRKEYSFEITSDGELSNANVVSGKLLKGNVSVGDRIYYDIEYKNVYDSVEYNAENGWRVLDDGKMNGTSGKVRLISYSIPCKWIYNSNNDDTINVIQNSFDSQKVKDYDGKNKLASEYIIEEIAEKVSILFLEDLNNSYNKLYNEKRNSKDISDINKSGNDMFANGYGNFYWIPSYDNSMYIMSDISMRTYEVKSSTRSGVKIVVTLKDGLTGNYEDNIWKINN